MIKQNSMMLMRQWTLTPAALTRALVTCTEAKTAAIQELLAPSRYSMGLATGSGTDGTILAANRDSDVLLTNAGKHSKLGELIGKAVKQAVKQALSNQSGLNPRRQHQVSQRIDRFGITEQSLWEEFKNRDTGLNRAEFSQKFDQLSRQSHMVTACSLYAHLLDQLMWELLDPEETWAMGQTLLAAMQGKHLPVTSGPADRQEMLTHMIRALSDTLLTLLTV